MMTTAVGNRFNNPGDLLYGTGWTGQGAPYKSPNGLTYATFLTPDAGVHALYADLTTAISKGHNTVAGLIYHYLGTSTNNRANPNVQNYLNTVVQSTGLSANSPITAADVPNLAYGIATAEGTAGSFPQLAANRTGPASWLDGFNQWISDPYGAAQNAVTGAEGITAIVTQTPIGGITPGQAESAAGATVAASTGVDLSGVTGALNTFNQTVSTVFSKDTWTRAAVIVVAIVLLIGALIMLSKGPVLEASKVAMAAA